MTPIKKSKDSKKKHHFTNYIFDFDSTFIRLETLDELAKIVLKNKKALDSRSSDEILKKIQDLTEKGMNGELSFSESLKLRLQYLSPTTKDLEELTEKLKNSITPSFLRNKPFFTNNKNHIFILSGGFLECILPIAKLFSIPKYRVFANSFVYDLEGKIIEIDHSNPLSQDLGKVKLLKKLNLQGEVIIIGDGYTDYEVKKNAYAQKFVAFTENVYRKPIVELADFEAQNLEEFILSEKQSLKTNTQTFPSPKKILLLEDIHPKAFSFSCKDDDSTISNTSDSNYTIERLPHSLPFDELSKKIEDVSILGIRSKTPISSDLLKKAKKLLAIGSFCIGTDQVDLKSCSQQGISVFNAPYSNTRSVVELAIASIIMLVRKVFVKNNLLHNKIWDKSCDGAVEVRGKKLGIIGYGNIGSQLSVIAEALGLQVYFYDLENKLPLGNATCCKSLDELLRIADIVSIHVNGESNNIGLVDSSFFSSMKTGATFINFSRGNVVNISDLAKAIKSKKLSGCAIDVYPSEPKLSKDSFVSELQNLPNVILTPHIGGNTMEAQENIGEYVSSQLLSYLEEGNTLGSVNFPQMQLSHPKNKYRLIHIHKNIPGVLASINNFFGEKGVNIAAQSLKTTEDLGYLITDVCEPIEKPILQTLEKMEETIQLRVINP